MLISFDSKAYLFSNLRGNEKLFNQSFIFKENLLKYLGQGSGPQEFITELILNIKTKKLANVTYNFLRSDIHIINSGNYSFLWKKFNLKDKNKVIIRLDGIGNELDLINSNKLKNNSFLDITKKADHAIFQSQFCKDCFRNIYNFSPNSQIIYNGASNLKPLFLKRNKLLNDIKTACPNGYLVVAGRNSSRKRILETVNKFHKLINFKKIKLVVLSNLSNALIPKNNRIINLGMLEPNIARNIIANSKGLIHIDKYDWCPNIVVMAIHDMVPVICSNFGGTKEIVRSNGFILREFPNNLPSNLEGIEYVMKSKFPDKLFKDVIEKLLIAPPTLIENDDLNINKTSSSYIGFCKKVLGF